MNEKELEKIKSTNIRSFRKRLSDMWKLITSEVGHAI